MLEEVRPRLVTLFLGILLYSAVSSAQSDPRAKALCAQVPSIAAELTEISGMKLRHPVPCDFISKEQINQFLKKRVKETSSPEEIRAEELTLKKFGLIPQNFDLAKNEVDLLTEQAAAFYDYNRKKLFITDSTSTESQTPVLAHELSHALADQNYNLGRFIRQGRKSDDGSTARLAVMEGQATWMMSEYLARQAGTSLKDSATLAAAMANLAAGDEDGDSTQSEGEYPVFDKEPLYLRLTLVFPYTKGMSFQQAVLVRDPQHGLRRGLSASAGLYAADSAPREVFPARPAGRSGAPRGPPATRVQGPGGRRTGRTGAGNPAAAIRRQDPRRRPGAALARLQLRAAGE